MYVMMWTPQPKRTIQVSVESNVDIRRRRQRGPSDLIPIFLYSITALMVLVNNVIFFSLEGSMNNPDVNVGSELEPASVNSNHVHVNISKDKWKNFQSNRKKFVREHHQKLDKTIQEQQEKEEREEEGEQEEVDNQEEPLESGEADEDENENENIDENEDTGDGESFPSKYLGSAHLDTKSYQPKGGNRFREWKDGSTPYRITQSIKDVSDDIARERREHVKAAMKHAWDGYKAHAFGADEVRPISGGSMETWGGLGVTLVDALDTLWLMDLKDEFYEARDWVRDHLNFNIDKDVSVFETTIRSLGGLLSAYGWSGDDVFLEKAIDLGDRLLKAFDEPGTNGVPIGQVNLKTGRTSSPGWLHGQIILADMATLPVEFRQLSKFTQDQKYAEKAEKVYHILKKLEPQDGLFPGFLAMRNGKLDFSNHEISFGPFGDSFYEYELKIWLQGGRKEDMYREMYDRSMNGMHNKQLKKSNNDLAYINFGHESTRMDHLTCFMGGLLALGAWTDPSGFKSERAQKNLKTAKALGYTCYQMYATMPSGLSGDVVAFHNSAILPTDKAYKLRPETVESMFILHRVTGDPIYREWGWEIFQSIEKYCRTDIAYAKVRDVMSHEPPVEDKMESFFLGETLKYLYLLFDPDSEVNVDKYVFNTEAHPFLVK